MQFGVCSGPEMAEAAAKCGYEYFEWKVGGLLKPREAESAFKEARRLVQKAALPCPVVNGLFPVDLKITGPTVDLDALEAYLRVACRRAEKAGVAFIVFGSGAARRIPDGFSRSAAWDQLVAFCQMAGMVAACHGIVIVVEPLSTRESNILNTVEESARLVRTVDHPSIRLLVDGYHWALEGDSEADISANGSLLVHAHLATTANRMAPGAEEGDFRPFFRALARAGYTGRLSIEGKIPEPMKDLPRALALMSAWAGGA